MEVVLAVIIMMGWTLGLLFAIHQSGKLVDIIKEGKRGNEER